MKHEIVSIDKLRDSRIMYDKKIPGFGYAIIITVALLIAFVVIWSINTNKTYVIKTQGTVQSNNKNYVMSPYAGVISDINVVEGGTVEKGQVLFQVMSTDLNLKITQLIEQKKVYEEQEQQLTLLVKSIHDDVNYFDMNSENDNLYCSQYRLYKSKVAQNQLDTSALSNYGYTDEQIEKQVIINREKNKELYYSAIQEAESSLRDVRTQENSIDAQLTALREGQDSYTVTAVDSGCIHILNDIKTGMVVQSGTAIASIIPECENYSIIACMSPADVSRISMGDNVDIAISGLNQSVYGTISGVVESIDSDVTVDSSSSNAENTAYFKVYIKPYSNELKLKSGDIFRIFNGASVEARIQYNKITYFEYVLDALGIFTI